MTITMTDPALDALIAPAKPKADHDESRLQPPKRDLRILIVEDDHDLRDAMREVFMLKGYVVNTARDGFSAVDLGWSDRYDVVISDIRLPGMDGFAVTRSLKSRVRSPEIILITAFPEWNVYEEAIRAGARTLLRKPLDLSHLIEVVEQALGGRPC